MSASAAEDTANAPLLRLLAPGEMVDGRYRIEAYLGGGGMASVYRATHVVLEQPVAIKVVAPQIREVPGMAQRFLREARAATQLKSEHVARVSDVGTMADGAPYMVMEYLDGRDLDAILEAGQEISVEDAVDYVLQACEALAEVHGLGIVHRDLKPANLFLTRGADGLPCVKLIDFGISRTDSPLSPEDVVALTHPEMIMGSPRYMSPEQMESATKADSRSDIYGIGAVLYELLTRKAPHEGATVLDIYAAVTLGPPAAPSTLRPDVPKELDEVILRCLKIDPAERYADTADLACALAPFGPAGSLGRAEAIARIHDAARSRARDGGALDEAVSGDEGSRVRRRVSSSAHALRQRRIRRGATVAVLFAVGLLGVGARAFYMQSHGQTAASVAVPPAATNAPPVTPSPVTPPPVTPPPAVATAPDLAAPAKTTVTTSAEIPAAAQHPSAAEPAATAPRPAQPAVTKTSVAAAPVTRAFEPPPAALPPPPPRPSPTPPPANTQDERKLFEDRK